MTPKRAGSSAGFTLLELATVIAVVAILVVLLFPAINSARSHIEKVNCISNLRHLYVAADAYYQQNHHWPQVSPALLNGGSNAYDEAWIEAFMPYGIGRQNWICPTIQRYLGNPDYTQPANYRADYVAMPFDIKPTTPLEWPQFPWFVERGNVHGNGNLMVLANGSVTELNELAPSGQ